MSGTSKKEKEIELLHTILQHCDGSIFVTDGEGRIIFSNDESSQALGLATEDLLHMTIYDLVDAGITKGAVSVKVIERRCPVTDRFTTLVTERTLLPALLFLMTAET